MPPRKSTSATPDDPDAAPVTATEQQLKARSEGGVNVEDYLLPRSLTLRLAKSVLPPNTSIQKDAVLAIQKAATVFVSYLSSHANEATLKRTVAPSDVFGAITELEFESFRARLEKELDAHAELKAGKRRGKKGSLGKEGEGKGDDEGRDVKRVKTGTSGTGTGTGVAGGVGDVVEDDGDETQDEPGMQDDEDEEDEEGEEDEEEEEEEDEADGEEREDEEDVNRVEDLDHDATGNRPMDPDASDHSDSETEGPSAQLGHDGGFG